MQTTIAVSSEGALLLARLLRPRVEQLVEQLEAQVRELEEGNTAWAITADELTVAREALTACQNACLEAGA